MGTEILKPYVDNYLFSSGGAICQETTATPLPKEATCYICKSDKHLDAPSARLVRDCSCRGDSGYAHTRCIVKSAETYSSNNTDNWLQCRLRWTTCPNCNGRYKNELAYSLSVRFTDYLNSFSLDEHHIYVIYSWIITLHTISDMYARIPHNPRYNRLGKKSAQDIINSMNEMVENDMNKQNFIFAKAAVCYNLGQFDLITGTDQSVDDAKGNFMVCLNLCKSIGLVEDGEDGIIKLVSRGLDSANNFLNWMPQTADADDDIMNCLLQELSMDGESDSMDIETNTYAHTTTSIEADNFIESNRSMLDSIGKEWTSTDNEDKLLVNDNSKITPKKRRVESNDSADTSQDDATTTNPTTNAHAPPRGEMDIDAPTSSQDLDNTPEYDSAASNTTPKEAGLETNVTLTTNPPSTSVTAEDPVDYCMEMKDDTPKVLIVSSRPVDTPSYECANTTNGDCSDSSEEDDESYSSSDQSSEDDDSEVEDDSVVEDLSGGWNGCGCTKQKLFAQPFQQIESMINVDDTSSCATKRLGDIIQFQYAKVEEGMKKYNAMKSDNSPEFIDTLEFKSICEETARLIKQEFPGYTGDLRDFVELLLLGRVSPGTEHLNTGKTQGARMLVDAKLREENDYFNYQVVVNPKFFLEIAHDRRLMEECSSIHEVIKAAHYSSSKEVHLFVNDSLRSFYESIQHRFLLEVLKALNPNKVIVIRLCRNGLMSTNKNEKVIQLVNTRESGLSALRKELSHVSPSENVPVTKLDDPKQADIDKRALELKAKWRAAGRYPKEVKDAFTAGQDYTPSKDNGPEFRQMIKDTKSELQEAVPEMPSFYDKSVTEKGSSIVHNRHVSYFGRKTEGEQVSDGIVALIRTSSKIRKAKVDKDGMPVECIDSVASIVACIELRKEQGLLSDKAELKYIIYGRCRSRSSIVSEHDNKVLDIIRTCQIGYLFTTSPNRINEDPTVVQTYIGPVELQCSKESGKEIGPILQKEEERKGRNRVITDTCNKGQERVESSCKEVNEDPSFHNLLKKVSNVRMPKEFVVQVEEYNSTASYPAPLFPLSSVDLQHQKQLEVCNEKAKKYLELRPKPKRKKKKNGNKGNKNSNQKAVLENSNQKAVLKTWFNANITNPYPNEGQQQELERRTGLSREQVQRWLTDKRSKDKRRQEIARKYS